MSYPIKYPTPQGANIQTFYKTEDWVKPQGASFVWFTLIGAGGATDGTATYLVGGGSAAVTNFMCPAFLIPDVLRVQVGRSLVGGNGEDSTILYQQKDGSGYTLLTARGGLSGDNGGSSGPASTANNFTAMGFFQSVAGQDGRNTGLASATTFLSGGVYGGAATANYGYTNAGSGFFQMQPIIVGAGGGSSGSSKGGVGCGGGGTTGIGGDGMVVIITW